jgi:hypothetical protein
MAGVMENYSKFEVCAVIWFLQAEGVSQSEIHCRSVRVYGQNVFSRKEVSVWCNIFKDGQTARKYDAEKHRGRPAIPHTGENCVVVEGLMKEDRRIKTCRTHCKTQLCITSHSLERNTALKECLNLWNDWIHFWMLTTLTTRPPYIIVS